MTKSKKFIETKEYKRFAEFCDARIEYKYIGVCYGLPGVGKTLSSKYYSDWDFVDSQIHFSHPKLLATKSNIKILAKKVLFYTAPSVKATKMTEQLSSLNSYLNMAKSVCEFHHSKEEEYTYKTMKDFEDIDLLIVDEIDRLKLQSLEQIRALYDQHNFAIVLIGMPGIEKKLARYP